MDRESRQANSPKIAHDLRQRLATATDGTTVPVIVRYRGGALPKVPKGSDLRVRRTFHVIPALAADIPAGDVGALAADDSVERVWLDFRVRALLDVAVPSIGVDLAWQSGLTGSGVRIAIIDTGIDPDHPDFADRVTAAVDYSTSGILRSRSRRRRLTQSTVDGNGHGTHVAGIAAGNGSASEGRFCGVAPEAELLIAKTLADDGSGDASDVIAGLEWAMEQGAQVACLSLGGSHAGDGTDALSTLCDELSELGLVICVAAGNSGPRALTIGPPGCAREVITVGAAEVAADSCQAPTVAAFSSRGPTTDGRVKPDLVLPGVGIASCRAAKGTMGEPVSEFPQYYVRASGSSMAAPFAAGAAALILEANPDFTPRQVRELLCGSALDLGDEPNAQGSGLAQVAASLQAEPTADVPESETTPPSERQGCLVTLLPVLAAMLPSPGGDKGLS